MDIISPPRGPRNLTPELVAWLRWLGFTVLVQIAPGLVARHTREAAPYLS